MIRVSDGTEKSYHKNIHFRGEECIKNVDGHGHEQKENGGDGERTRDCSVLNLRILNSTRTTKSNEMMDYSAVEKTHE